MMEECENQIGTMTQARKSAIGLLPNLPGVLRGRVQEMSLHIAMTFLLGIQVRSVGRQLLHHDLGVLSSIAFHRGGAMGRAYAPLFPGFSGVFMENTRYSYDVT